MRVQLWSAVTVLVVFKECADRGAMWEPSATQENDHYPDSARKRPKKSTFLVQTVRRARNGLRFTPIAPPSYSGTGSITLLKLTDNEMLQEAKYITVKRHSRQKRVFVLTTTSCTLCSPPTI